jgi:hypothetical protein
MNKYNLPCITIACLLLCSCQFSKGMKKDLATGLTTNYNGLALDDIYLADADGKKLSSNEIRLRAMVMIVAEGVDFFAVKDEKVFPGCRIILKDKLNKEILHLSDAFSDLSNGTAESQARVLRAKLNTGAPMTVGETYRLNVRFFDKIKKENVIISNVDLIVTN